MPVRELRSIVVIELIAVLAVAVIPFPEPITVAIPLLVVATLSRWIRGRSWAEGLRGGWSHVGVGALVGVTALGLALVLGAPIVAELTRRSVEWSQFPVVRGSTMIMFTMVLFAAVTALATELALRGWIVERVLELAPSRRVVAVLVGAIAEAVVTPGDLAARCGAGMFGLGLGWIYVASGRSLTAPLVARMCFACCAVVLESLRVIG